MTRIIITQDGNIVVNIEFDEQKQNVSQHILSVLMGCAILEKVTTKKEASR